MTDQSDKPLPQQGDSTVPLVPEHGYSQPDVPPLEETAWPDFSFNDPSGDALFGASEPTVATGGYAPTTPLPSADPGLGSPYAPPAGPQPTTPLPYANPQPGTAYQQPSVPPYQPTPVAPAPRPAEPTMYETYRPYTPPVPVAYNYPLAPTSAPEHPNAVSALVLGIAGLVAIPVLAPVAWFIASRGRREMRQYPGRWGASGSLTAGYVLGIIGTVIWAVAALFFVLFFVLAFAAMTVN